MRKKEIVKELWKIYEIMKFDVESKSMLQIRIMTLIEKIEEKE